MNDTIRMSPEEDRLVHDVLFPCLNVAEEVITLQTTSTLARYIVQKIRSARAKLAQAADHGSPLATVHKPLLDALRLSAELIRTCSRYPAINQIALDQIVQTILVLDPGFRIDQPAAAAAGDIV